VWAITIADAAAAVPCASEVEERAQQLGATFYNLDGHVERPMLPPEISEDGASLLRDQRRRGLTLFVPPGPTEPYFALTWITVNHSFTYEEWPGSRIAWMLKVEQEEPHAFVERLMILYNRRAADLFRRHPAVGGLVRTQSAADYEEVRGWAAINPALAYLANEAASYEFATTDHDQSHAGLAVNAYTHITSPLRRYADLHNQRVLKAILRAGAAATPPSSTYSTLPDHLNERMKAQRRWSRDLTFLANVRPGLVHTIDIVWVDATRVWVPAWKRLLRLRHDPADIPPPGTAGSIEVFCDPSRRNWRQRILTAPTST
jgi:exoribonuclease R